MFFSRLESIWIQNPEVKHTKTMEGMFSESSDNRTNVPSPSTSFYQYKSELEMSSTNAELSSIGEECHDHDDTTKDVSIWLIF